MATKSSADPAADLAAGKIDDTEFHRRIAEAGAAATTAEALNPPDAGTGAAAPTT